MTSDLISGQRALCDYRRAAKSGGEIKYTVMGGCVTLGSLEPAQGVRPAQHWHNMGLID